MNLTNFYFQCRIGQPTAHRPHVAPSDFYAAARSPEEKKILWMNIMCTFAKVLGVAHDNFFSAGSGKKVSHHCLKREHSLLLYRAYIKHPSNRSEHFAKLILQLHLHI